MAGKRRLPSERPYRETGDVTEATARLVLAIGKRVAVEDPSDLEHLLRLEEAVGQAMTTAIRGLQTSGYSNQAIGDALGVTRQRITQQWPRLDDSSPDDDPALDVSR